MAESHAVPSRLVNAQPVRRKLLLWAAQGFGVGWIPFAPGTFGSILGFGWLALLLVTGQWWVLLVGSVAGSLLAVWLCGAAEEVLGRKDPGSVVLDEVAASPVCLWAWAVLHVSRHHGLPSMGEFFSWNNWPLIVCVFAGFRFFDVLKPWPVGRSQSLPGGWGIVLDDLLAAGYVNVLVVAGWWLNLF